MNRLFLVYYITESGVSALHDIFTALLQAVEEAERLRDKYGLKVKVQMATVDIHGMHVRKNYEI